MRPILLLVSALLLKGTGWAQTQKGADIDGWAAGGLHGYSVSMPNASIVAVGAPGNDERSARWPGHVQVYMWNGAAWVQRGKFISGEAAGDLFGSAVHMPDASTIAIGAPGNDGAGNYAGHVRVYTWNGAAWVQKGKEIDGEAEGDYSGSAVYMPDASTIAVGARNNDGAGANSGHVRIFRWDGAAWLQKGKDIDGEASFDYAGISLSMPDASTIAIGAFENDGAGKDAGHVRIYSWNGGSWVQKGKDIDAEAADDGFGTSVSMPDASTVAIGGPFNDGAGIRAGHVRVYAWNGSSWVQKGKDIDGEAADDMSGTMISMPDASTIAIGSQSNDGAGKDAGHVRIYSWDGTAWLQLGSDIDGEAEYDKSATSVSMPDASTIAIGARNNRRVTNSTDRTSDDGRTTGHVRIYTIPQRAQGPALAARSQGGGSEMQQAKQAEGRSDWATAKSWYEKAAAKGNVDAMFALGHHYSLSSFTGKPSDTTMALMWYKKAADLQNLDAMMSLGGIYRDELGVKRDMEKAIQWYTKAANGGNATATYYMARMYAIGDHIPQDFEMARKWYVRLAEMGEVVGMVSAAMIYRSDLTDKKDFYTARKWFEKAAAEGDASAMFYLGEMDALGEGAPQDYQKARQWFEKAAEKGHDEAMYTLGLMYQHGMGVEKNLSAAKSWFQKTGGERKDDAAKILKTLP